MKRATVMRALRGWTALTLLVGQCAWAQSATALAPSALAAAPSPLMRAAPRAGELHILSYHDVAVDETAKRALRDPQAVSVPTLVQHFSWLRDNGYAVVSMTQLLNARAGGKPLPPRAVLLSFDDAYKSFHSHVLPLLELFDFSATLAVVGLWIETADSQSIPFGDDKLSRARFMSWLELRDVVASGRVEIASHSFDLHRGNISNPQRNVQPSATSLRFDVGLANYETAASLTARVRDDLQRNNALLLQRLGVRPRVMVWPYGAYTPNTQRIAAELGLAVGLTLDNGSNSIDAPLTALNRVLMQRDTEVADLERSLRPQRERTERALEIDLDGVFDTDNAEQEKRLSALLDRLQKLAPTTVYLKAISAQRDAAGRPGAYFPSAVLPLRGDLFNRVAWQIRSRLGISVFAWLPTAELPPSLTVATDGALLLQTLFADMARSVPLAGVYFSESDDSSDARIKALIQALAAERPRLRIARFFAPPRDIADGNADGNRAQWLSRSAGIDWMVMAPPSSTTPAVASDESAAWGLAPAPVVERRRMEQRLKQWALHGVPLERVLWRAPDDTATAAATLTSAQALATLHAAGARHFSYGAMPKVDVSNDDLRRLLSTEGTPLVR